MGGFRGEQCQKGGAVSLPHQRWMSGYAGVPACYQGGAASPAPRVSGYTLLLVAFDQEHVMFSLQAERVAAAGGNCEHAVHCLRQELLVACNLLVWAKHERLAEFVGESECGCYIGVFAG